MPAVTRSKPKFEVKDKVAFTFGTRRVKGFVVEDRGPLGVGGRRIYGVRLDMDPDDSMYFELPEDDLEASPEPDPSLTKHEICEYLTTGGLMLVLHSGSDRGVWLRRDNLGNVTHTFVQDRGLVGGAVPPVFAFHDGSVFSGRRHEVVEFVVSFGLSEQKANEVVDRVSTKP